MFGKRIDGTRVTGIDPIVALTPYIMPPRSDSQVFTRQELDFDSMTRYIRDKRKEGINVTHMGMFIAAYLRVLGEYPEMNRFVVNKRLYARNHICISFVTLRKTGDDRIEESLCKVYFSLTDTIKEVTERLDAAIAAGRKEQNVNNTDALARFLMKMPLLPDIVVGLARFMDNHGIMPKFIHEASPFHTSLFISNMASLGMSYIYHHIYNFGTTSVFVTMGKTEQRVYHNNDGTCRSKRIMPLGITIDERIASGGVYARAFSRAVHYLQNPELLETAPDVSKIKTETKMLPVTKEFNV